MIASLDAHLLPYHVLHLLDDGQHQGTSGKGCGTLARSRDVRQGGFERSKLLEVQRSWKELLLLSGQSCQWDASDLHRRLAQFQDVQQPHPARLLSQQFF
jgi:hypothetical protein